MLRWVMLGGVLATPIAPAIADEVAEARQALAAFDLRVRGDLIVMDAELKLARGFQSARKARMQFTRQSRNVERLEKTRRDEADEIVRLKGRWVSRNAALARGDVVADNRLVGELNALAGRISLLGDRQGQLSEQVEQERKDVAGARDAYVQSVMEMRTLADRIIADYEQSAADPEIRAAIDRLSAAAGKAYELAPSSSFQSALRRLASFEEIVLSDSIPLRGAHGVMFASVILNDRHPQEFAVDSGAAFVCLSQAMAAEIGLVVNDSNRTVILRTADGRNVPAKLTMLESVRIGKFTVENVEAVVLGAEAPNAEPLLGMSFLGRFQFKIDTQAGTISLTKLEIPDPKSSGRKR